MKLLFASAEIYPYAKTGGLADVAQALPNALPQTIEVRSIMPLYDFIDREIFGISPLERSFRVTLGEDVYEITLYHGINRGIETLFVYTPLLCSRPSLYGDARGDYPDNALRFGLFSKALVVVAQMYAVDILHLNDWHTALAALWAREIAPQLRTVFTIHNLAFQGIFPQTVLRELGLNDTYFHPEGIEFWGQMNCMKAGIAYSSSVTTVSPRYAMEILQPEFGCGLDGFLVAHQHKLTGILNGIDTKLFDPEHDPVLSQNYSYTSFQDKKLTKYSFCQEQNLAHRDRPLFIFIGRFTHQKGVDLLIDVLPELLKLELNLAILGEGDGALISALQDAAQHHKNLLHLLGYDESLSHRMYAAADFLLMPSSFEPCGLNQLIALRYGTVPIVHRVGGLYDTVKDRSDQDASPCGQGFAMKTFDPIGLKEVVKRAVRLYKTPKPLERLAKHNMQCDVSFLESAKAYLDHYGVIL